MPNRTAPRIAQLPAAWNVHSLTSPSTGDITSALTPLLMIDPSLLTPMRMGHSEDVAEHHPYNGGNVTVSTPGGTFFPSLQGLSLSFDIDNFIRFMEGYDSGNSREFSHEDSVSFSDSL